jgi:uncharacterized protein (UPF0276 family)
MTAVSSVRPRIGVAFGPHTPTLLEADPESIDYVEVPYELLRHDPSVISFSRLKPFILHCASLSIAGTISPSDETINDIRHWVRRTDTPWLGEHLSFITADRPENAFNAEEYAPGEPYNIGYTVSPPMNDTTVEVVLESIASYARRFNVPLLLENPPLYLSTPGSTLSQVEFITRICSRSPVLLLLDLTHFYITSRNMGFDARDENRCESMPAAAAHSTARSAQRRRSSDASTGSGLPGTCEAIWTGCTRSTASPTSR